MKGLCWLIEMQGPSYLTVRHAGGYEFKWTDDVYQALRFADREQADMVMMAVRQLRGDLFPACLTRVPCAVEHQFGLSEALKPHDWRLGPPDVPGADRPMQG